MALLLLRANQKVLFDGVVTFVVFDSEKVNESSQGEGGGGRS